MRGLRVRGVLPEGRSRGRAQRCQHPERLEAWVTGCRLSAVVLLASGVGGKGAEGNLWK